jgi:N-acetylneuraminate synthase
MSGNSNLSRRIISKEETQYLDALVRGVYARRQIPAGYIVDHKTFAEDFFLAIPLVKGQLSTREVLNGTRVSNLIEPGSPLTINDLTGPYSDNLEFKKMIMNRGL